MLETDFRTLLYSDRSIATASPAAGPAITPDSHRVTASATEARMTPGSRNMLIGSVAVSGIVAILAVLDIATGKPFAGQMVMDIMFILSAALVGYMGFSAFKELS